MNQIKVINIYIIINVSTFTVSYPVRGQARIYKSVHEQF